MTTFSRVIGEVTAPQGHSSCGGKRSSKKSHRKSHRGSHKHDCGC
jgi:hypothetical protein